MKDENKLFKSEGMLWQPQENVYDEWLGEKPLCSSPGCRAPLDQKQDNKYLCVACGKEFYCPKGFRETHRCAELKWRGHQLRDHDVVSLDLPPTRVVDEDKEDENYWVQARISEKGGKRMAVVYFGERLRKGQKKEDYSQVFLDFDDEQLRFDKSNKNPMKLLAKLTAEFWDSTTTIQRNMPDTGSPHQV